MLGLVVSKLKIAILQLLDALGVLGLELGNYIETLSNWQYLVSNCSAAMVFAISFGHANFGFQAGTINGSVNTVFHHHAVAQRISDESA